MGVYLSLKADWSFYTLIIKKKVLETTPFFDLLDIMEVEHMMSFQLYPKN